MLKSLSILLGCCGCGGWGSCSGYGSCGCASQKTVYVNTFTGITGPTGPAGATGATGATGPAGATDQTTKGKHKQRVTRILCADNA